MFALFFISFVALLFVCVLIYSFSLIPLPQLGRYALTAAADTAERRDGGAASPPLDSRLAAFFAALAAIDLGASKRWFRVEQVEVLLEPGADAAAIVGGVMRSWCTSPVLPARERRDARERDAAPRPARQVQLLGGEAFAIASLLPSNGGLIARIR